MKNIDQFNNSELWQLAVDKGQRDSKIPQTNIFMLVDGRVKITSDCKFPKKCKVHWIIGNPFLFNFFLNQDLKSCYIIVNPSIPRSNSTSCRHTRGLG